MTSLFEWFNNRIKSAYKIDLGSTPQKTLKKLCAPQKILKLFNKKVFFDREIASFKTCFDGQVPDLEAQSRTKKRSVGKFYTPEGLAGTLSDILLNELNESELQNSSHLIADPSCGDGSFLTALAHRLSNKKIDNCLSLLYGCDIDVYALFVALTRLITTFKNSGWPVIEKRDFLLKPPRRKFCAIIGNPPYKVNLSDETKKSLASLYSTAEGEFDLYTFFIEASFKALLPNAPLVLITSRTYLVNHQCGKIRKFIFEKNKVKALLMLPPRFFKAAPGVSAAVLIGLAGNKTPQYSLSIKADFTHEGSLNKAYTAINTDFLSNGGLKKAIVPKSLKNLFEIMNKCPRVSDFCIVKVGIQEHINRSERANRPFVADEAKDYSYKPVLRGREISPFCVNWENKFICYGPHLAHMGDKKDFEKPKLLYQNIRNECLKYRLVAALDKQGFYPKNSLSYIISKTKQYSECFLEGLLNSVLINAWFSGHFHSFHITISQVRQIPLPNCGSTEIAEVKAKTKKIKKLIKNKKNCDKAINELNEAVCRCYGFNENLSELISRCDKFLEQAACL